MNPTANLRWRLPTIVQAFSALTGVVIMLDAGWIRARTRRLAHA
jgi:hypothetical protein